MSENVVPDEAGKARRQARAEQFFEEDLAGQRDWYSRHAGLNKANGQRVGLAILLAGALTAAVSVFTGGWVNVATAALGGIVAVLQGWKQIARYDETWMGYRVASERMKRERRLYANLAGTYRELDEDEAYLQFVESIEKIIAEEQQIFWPGRTERLESGQRAKQNTE